MGTYTTNYGLLKAGDGTVDPVDDYVDVISQLDRNLDLIDDFGYRACEYNYTDSRYDDLPTVGNNVGDKIFNNFDHSFALWDGNSWVQTLARGPVWTDATLNSGFTNSGTTYNVGYYTEDSNARCTMRGRFMRLSSAIFTNGTVFTPISAGVIPVPVVPYQGIVVGVAPSGRQAQYYSVNISTSGVMTVTRYGSVAQTAGDSTNYVELDGFTYGLS